MKEGCPEGSGEVVGPYDETQADEKVDEEVQEIEDQAKDIEASEAKGNWWQLAT